MIAMMLVQLTTALVVKRSVVVNPSHGAAWSDVTSQVATAIPPLEWSLVTVESADGQSRLLVTDPEVLSIGPGVLVAEPRQAVALGAHYARPLLPSFAALVLLTEGDTESMRLELHIEAAEPLLTSPPRLVGQDAIVQAALRVALAAQGVSQTEIAELEAEHDPSAAGRTYDSFIKTGMPRRVGTLMPAAQRAAHHIRHLIREQAAARAEFLRNTDSADAARDGLPRHALHLVLDNVRSAYNVGSIFRTADTARCAEVVTCGFTPHPPNPKLAKTAFGAIGSVPTRHEESTLHAVRALQASGIAVYAMETTERSINYSETAFPQSGIALVLGNEQTGVDTQVMAAVDGIIEIPTLGLKNSLNVATASGIVTFEALRQWGALHTSSSTEPS